MDSQPLLHQIRMDDPEIAFETRTDRDLFRMEWMFRLMNNPSLNRLAIRSLLASIAIKLPVKGLIRATIFDHFCGGETREDCQKTIEKLAASHIGTILDYSVEGEKTESGFDRVETETRENIRVASGRKDLPFAVFKTSGIAPVEILEQVQSGSGLSKEDEKAFHKARLRFGRICEEAARQNVRLFVDAEESWIQNVIDQWTYEEMALHNQKTALVYNTYQLYRSDVLNQLKSALLEARQKGYFLGAKLVRGAYMEKEAAYAEKHNLKNPIHPHKTATDTDFNSAWQFCLDNLDRVYFCAGSHNEASNEALAYAVLNKGMERNDGRIWFAQLYGMSDNISYALAREGFNVAKYVPYGPVFAVMPYLVRRAEENTSVAGQTSRELSLIRNERERRRKRKAR